MSTTFVGVALLATVVALIISLVYWNRLVERPGRHDVSRLKNATAVTDVLSRVATENGLTSNREEEDLARPGGFSENADTGLHDVVDVKFVRPYVRKIDDDVKELGWFEKPPVQPKRTQKRIPSDQLRSDGRKSSSPLKRNSPERTLPAGESGSVAHAA